MNQSIKPSDLHVIAVISNPIRFRSRYVLYKDFEKRMLDAGVTLYTVEVAFGARPFEITRHDNPHHIQYRTYEELWHKENMINVALTRLPHHWEYMAWIDADIGFCNPQWATETIQQLQHHMVVQMFAECYDLGPSFESIQKHQGFAWSYLHNCKRGPAYTHWHPGYAWAARREAIEGVGGLLDIAILGAGDHHMALALIGDAKSSIPGKAHPNYARHIMAWQERAERVIKRDIGYTHGAIFHYWHGKKAARKYVERWAILLDNKFDPDADIIKDPQGLWQLNTPNIKLRDQIRLYFRQRNEDGIDI